MICQKVKAKLPDLLLAPESVTAEVRGHMAGCAECGKELAALEATMAALDAWDAPEVSPYFDARMAAMLREEKGAAPAGWLERMRARLKFGTKMDLRPLMAATLALVVAAGGGMYAGFVGFSSQPVRPAVQTASPVIGDLESLDENSQLFQQLNSLDQQDTGENSGGAGSSL
jgi:anti-sigma factor RsiW